MKKYYDINHYIDLDSKWVKNEYGLNITIPPKVNQLSEDGEFRFIRSRKYIFGVVYTWRKTSK